MIRTRCALVAFFVAVACASCGNGDAATVGSIHISQTTLARELAVIMHNDGYVEHLQENLPFLMKAGGPAPPPLVAQVLTNEIRAAVIDQLASSHSYTLNASDTADARLDAVGGAGSPQVFSKFPRWYQRVLIERSTKLAQVTRSLAPQTVEQYYSQARQEYTRACEWDIVTRTRDDAASARARITGGESFQSVARDVSIDKGSGPGGGNLGCNEKDNLVPELDQAAFTQPVGVVSQPIAVGDADAQVFHLILVTSRAPAPLPKVKGEVVAALAKLGAYNLQAELRARLVSARVHIAPDIGTWDPTRLIVLPPSVQPAVAATPKPRPLPPSVSSPSQMNASYQAGQQVFVTDQGVRPLLLTAIIDSKITWINDSHRTVSVRFVAYDHTLGPIKPGATASYTPDAAGSIAYELVGNPSVHGVVQVQWYYDPGEDPGAPNRLGADTPSPASSPPNR